MIALSTVSLGSATLQIRKINLQERGAGVKRFLRVLVSVYTDSDFDGGMVAWYLVTIYQRFTSVKIVSNNLPSNIRINGRSYDRRKLVIFLAHEIAQIQPATGRAPGDPPAIDVIHLEHDLPDHFSGKGI